MLGHQYPCLASERTGNIISYNTKTEAVFTINPARSDLVQSNENTKLTFSLPHGDLNIHDVTFCCPVGMFDTCLAKARRNNEPFVMRPAFAQSQNSTEMCLVLVR